MGKKEITTGTLLWAALKSLPYKRINRDMLGFKQHAKAPAIDLALAQAFARATGDDNPAYFGDDPIVPPFFLARLLYPVMGSVMLDPRLRINLVKMVHGEQKIEFYEPIRPGDQLDLDLEVKSISDTSAGEIAHLEISVTSNGKKKADTVIGLLVRSKRKRGSRKKAGKSESGPRKESFRIPIQTRDGQQLQYAEVSGDHNFIHTNYLLARLAGLPRTIMHGMCVMAMSSAALVNKLASGDPTRLKEIEGRFSSPVLPGQTLSVVAYATQSSDTTEFEVITPSGKAAIKNGKIKIS